MIMVQGGDAGVGSRGCRDNPDKNARVRPGMGREAATTVLRRIGPNSALTKTRGNSAMARRAG